MKIAGLHSGHDCSFCILEDGIPIFHAELERYTREQQPPGDSLKFLFEEYKNHSDIKHFAHTTDIYQGGIQGRYPNSYSKMKTCLQQSDGSFYEPGHHQAHAANAFFSSNFDEALIVTLDGGGPDYNLLKKEESPIICTITVWSGKGNKIRPIAYLKEDLINIGVMWNIFTTKIFGLSGGYPKGDQAGSVMAMGSMGDPSRYINIVERLQFKHPTHFTAVQHQEFVGLIEEAKISEKNKFDIAAALQACTETYVQKIIGKFVDSTKTENLCLAGGVALNSVMTGKISEWYNGKFKNIYIPPVPYDAGLSIGAAQYVWHQILDNPRVKWDDNASPYLGVTYGNEEIMSEISKFNNISFEKISIEDMLKRVADGKIVSVFSGKSESGRRALGNRSIIADPRNPNMKDIINEKVKHRQWYRPFAPSILREAVKEYFVRDAESPYMSIVLKFKPEMGKKVPAVNHYDGTARLQTVTEKDNPTYYNLLKKWEEISGVPIILNTSFNDREPIVETPLHALNCFIGTNIDYLYFADEEIMVSKND